MSTAPPPRIELLTLGGTIAMIGDRGSAVRPALEAGDLAELLPPHQRELVGIRTVATTPGASLDLRMLRWLAELIRDRLAAGAEGVVVTQGTDTIEEAAFALELLLGGAGPVVVTGAMRPADAASADGPRNLADAVSVALASRGRPTGVLVALDETIHAARFVTKRHRSRLGAFHSSPAGPLGHVVEGDARVFWLPPPLRLEAAPHRVGEPRVVVIPVGLGSGPEMLGGAEAADGVVVAGLGGGHVPEGLVEPLRELALTKPGILASRVPEGEILERTYAYPGSEQELLDHGLVPARWMDPWKARVLLELLLACELTTEQALDAFASMRDQVYVATAAAGERDGGRGLSLPLGDPAAQAS